MIYSYNVKFQIPYIYIPSGSSLSSLWRTCDLSSFKIICEQQQQISKLFWLLNERSSRGTVKCSASTDSTKSSFIFLDKPIFNAQQLYLVARNVLHTLHNRFLLWLVSSRCLSYSKFMSKRLSQNWSFSRFVDQFSPRLNCKHV